MSQFIASRVSKVLSEFSPTPRERAGLSVLLAVLCALLAGASWEWAHTTATATRTKVAELERMRTLALLESSPEYRLQVAHAAERARRWSFRDETLALARARVVEKIQDLATGAGFSEATVSIEEGRRGAGLDGPGVRAVTVRISGEGDVASFLALLQSVAESEESFAPVGASMQHLDDGNHAFTLTLRATALVGARP